MERVASVAPARRVMAVTERMGATAAMTQTEGRSVQGETEVTPATVGSALRAGPAVAVAEVVTPWEHARAETLVMEELAGRRTAAREARAPMAGKGSPVGTFSAGGGTTGAAHLTAGQGGSRGFPGSGTPNGDTAVNGAVGSTTPDNVGPDGTNGTACPE